LTDIESLRRLGLARQEANLPEFLTALEHPEAAYRALAARAVSWLRRPHLGRHLRRLVDDPDEDVRVAVAAGFAVLKDTSAGPPLIQALGADPASSVRSAAARSLGWLRLDAGASALIRHLTTDGSADVRAQAARALGRLRWQPAIGELLSALSDPAPIVRQGAISAIGDLFISLQSDDATDDSILNTLRARLSDSDPETRALALRALTTCGANDALDHALACLADPNPGVRITAAVALRRLDAQAALPALRTHAGDSHPEVAQQIRQTIQALESPRSVTGDGKGQ